MRKNLGYILVVFGIGLLFFVFYTNSSYHTKTVPFSKYTLLSSSWDKYKMKFINQDGRVIDFSQNDITTSEGQSYALLRAVWMDDRETFDRVWRWTNQTLKRPQDNLFGWKWGKRADASYGFYPDGGDNSASDADSDIAFSLILAGRRWNDQSYLQSAKKILSDIWRIETVDISGKRYLIAGNWAQNQQTAIINPSYFSPYAWRIFGEVDNTHEWKSLIIPAYDILIQSSTTPLDKQSAVGLVPDWLSISRENGEIAAPNLSKLTTNYGYDALRTPWRIGLDYQFNNDAKAREYLSIACKNLAEAYKADRKLVDIYAHDGRPIGKNESPSMYAAALGCFIPEFPDLAKEIYEQKILRLYSNTDSTFREDLPYYEQNWLWFGAALYNKSLQVYQ